MLEEVLRDESKLKEYLDFAKDTAYEAGKIMKEYFNEETDFISYKGDNTIVTLADKKINSYLIKKVKEKYIEHAVDGEEESFSKKSKFVWVCDPIDGTAMYARHIPVAVFSLALVYDGRPIIGVVYDPFTDNLYSAILTKGAYKNDKRIFVNSYKMSDIKTVGHLDMWSSAEYDVCKLFKRLKEETKVIDIGSIVRSSCCVATGDFSFAIFIGTEHKNCDIAAVKVIVEEAGGKVTSLFGEEQRYDQSIDGAVISNGSGIGHDKLIEIIKENIIRG